MIKLRIKESNNFLKENVITDIRTILKHLEPWNRATAEDWFKNSNINIQDCKLIPIAKPKGPTVAKKSEWPIIAIDKNNVPYWFGTGDYKTGRASRWRDNDTKQTQAFNDADEFFQVVPVDTDTYQSKSDIQKGRGQGVFVDINKYDPTKYKPIRHSGYDYGRGMKSNGWIEQPYGTSKTPESGMKYMTFDELDLYNPSTNRKKYTKILEETGLDVFIKRYNDICDKINKLNELFKEFDITEIGNFDALSNNGSKRKWENSLSYYQKALQSYSYAIQNLNDAYDHILDVQRYGADSFNGYESIKSDFKYIERYIKEAEQYLEQAI